MNLRESTWSNDDPFTAKNKSRLIFVALVVLFIVALLLRLIGINWGLPNQHFIYSSFIPDEAAEVITALLLGEGVYQYSVKRLQPFFYFLFFLYFLASYPVAISLGRVSNWSEFMALSRIDLPSFLLQARILVAMLGAVTVILTFMVGKRLFSRRVGLISALILSFSLGHIIYSRIARLDSIMPFLVILGFYFLLSLFREDGGRARLYATGFILAAAATTKLSGFAFLVPLLLVPFLDPDSSSWFPIRKPKLSREYVFAVFIYVAAYLAIAGPSHVFRLNIIFAGELAALPDSIAGIGSRLSSTDSYKDLGGLSAFEHSLPWHLASSLPRLMGLPIFLTALAGMLLLVIERQNRAGVILLLVTIAAFLLPIGYMQRAADRDVLPLLPLLAVCAAYGIDKAGTWVAGLMPSPRPTWLEILAVSLILLILMILPVRDVVHHARLILQSDTRDLAAEWIEDNIPAGSRLALGGYGPGILSEDISANLLLFGAPKIQDARPTYKLYDVQQGAATSTDVYDPEMLATFLQNNGIEYVILSSAYYHLFYNTATEYHFPDHVLQGRVFYDRLASELELVQVIGPNWDDAPGPIIQIYRVPSAAADESGSDLVEFDPYPNFDHAIRAIGYDSDALPWPWLKSLRWDMAAHQ